MKKFIILLCLLFTLLLSSGCSMAKSHNLYENKSKGPSMEYKGSSKYNRTRIEIRKGRHNNPSIEINSNDASRGNKFRITRKNNRIIVEAID